ncbi:asparagine--tRNA ligase [Eggerthellaceae bacterium 24-137]
MDRIKIAQLYADADRFAGERITVAGWVKSVRDMKNFGFVTLNDGSCFKDLQIVMEREALANYDEIAHQNVSAALVATGTLRLTPDAPQPFELAAAEIRVEGPSAPDYPLQKKRATVEFLRTQQHLRPRTNLFRAVFRVRSVAAASIHRFFQDRGFVYVHTPVITANDCEGAGEMFRVTTFDPVHAPRVSEEAAAASEGALVAGETDWSQDFFGEAASLTVSGQLNAENFAMAFGDVYTFGPTFRAENSNTARHAAEFWMVEPEMAFADLDDNMDVAEAMLKYVIEDVMERCPDELAMLNKFVDKGLLERLRHVAGSDFARITYTEAIDILLAAQEAGRTFEFPVEWGIDLQTEHERYLTEEHFRCPTFVTDYPAAIKAFYMRLNDDGRTVAAMDCLVPGIGEIVGGSQREERLEVLERRIEELDMDAEDYRAYLDLRRFGTCSHAGFGLGFERMVMYLTGVSNIRDVIPHPRTVGNAAF